MTIPLTDPRGSLTRWTAPAEFDLHRVAHGADGLSTIRPPAPGYHGKADRVLAGLRVERRGVFAPVPTGGVDGDVVQLLAGRERLATHEVWVGPRAPERVPETLYLQFSRLLGIRLEKRR